jgi:hypothetical protein
MRTMWLLVGVLLAALVSQATTVLLVGSPEVEKRLTGLGYTVRLSTVKLYAPPAIPISITQHYLIRTADPLVDTPTAPQPSSEEESFPFIGVPVTDPYGEPIVVPAPTVMTPADLTGVDVLYVDACYAAQLAGSQDVIANFLRSGHGLVLVQPNADGPVALLPAETPLTVTSGDYDGSHSAADPIRDMILTEAGKVHPLTTGLTTQDLGQYADKVTCDGLNDAWSVLGVTGRYVGIAVAQYGNGRLVFDAGNRAPEAMAPGSDLALTRMVDWAAGGTRTTDAPTPAPAREE